MVGECRGRRGGQGRCKVLSSTVSGDGGEQSHLSGGEMGAWKA